MLYNYDKASITMMCSNINETEHGIKRKTLDPEVYIYIYIQFKTKQN